MKTRNFATMKTGLAVAASLATSFAVPMTARAAEAALGTTQQAGPFAVTLIAAPKLGNTQFEARVTRDGNAVSPPAKVRLSLSMPYHKHGGTSNPLTDVAVSVSGGHYVGTVKLKMEGIYTARLSVQDAGQEGTAVYSFKVHRKAEVPHLGMWHPAGDFAVRLTTEPAPPKAGENTFRVEVTRNGVGVTGATVNLALTMPSMRMANANVSVTLAAVGNSYVGTAKLIHGGDWQARIAVRAAGKKGAAVYNFTAEGPVPATPVSGMTGRADGASESASAGGHAHHH
jgi:hypothetical protein